MFQNKLKEHTLKEKARDSCLAFSFSMKRSMKREIRKFTLWSCEGNVPKVISRCRLRSDAGILLSHPNFKTLTTVGGRAFVASAPKLWNDLSLEIRMAKSVDFFKKLLKALFSVRLFILS